MQPYLKQKKLGRSLGKKLLGLYLRVTVKVRIRVGLWLELKLDLEPRNKLFSI